MWMMALAAAVGKSTWNNLDKARVECVIHQACNLMYLSVCGDNELSSIASTLRNRFMEDKELPNLLGREADR